MHVFIIYKRQLYAALLKNLDYYHHYYNAEQLGITSPTVSI